MKQLTILALLSSTILITGCSGQQVADGAIGVAKLPFKVAGVAVTAAAGTAGALAGTAVGGPIGGAIGGAVGSAVVGAVVN
ncbi:hypothetical protein [Leucothrix mucor]|uniref:hypothetical protein n=1 Tax=Leucothrix mucor TaxID=45248 RepID=UPI0003B4F4D0|nr:hypothetical protein [Leucothrix mucor]